MVFAEGMEEAQRINEGFTDDAEAAAFWGEGAQKVPFEDLTFPGGGGQAQAARLYRGGGEKGVLLYVHGGGWARGSIALNEWSARALAAQSGWDVLGISYRLAPAHPFPAGLEDCRAALRFLQGQGAALGLDTTRIATGGASAGANLALCTALAEPGAFCGLVLFYGVFGADFDTPSYRSYGEGYGLSRARMMQIWQDYDPEGRRATEPLLVPLLARDLSHLPPACLIAAELDVLCDDSAAMAARLRDAGVDASHHTEPGVTHGFINRGRLVPAANASLDRAAAFLGRLA